MPERPPLSIVIGTTEGWPYVGSVLNSFSAEAAAAGAEIVIVDGSDRPPPRADAIGPDVRWLSEPGASVFRLFALGLAAAAGAIVATTEDHCITRPGWPGAILTAHTEQPDAAAIGGAIENGSTTTLLDWASYFTTQGPHMAPLGRRAVTRTTNEANLSLKRSALELLPEVGELGFMAILFTRRLAETGHQLRVDDRIVVDHFQSIGVRATSAIHYHNGRSIAGFRRARGMAAGDWLRLAAALLIPIWRTARAARVGWSKGRHRGPLLASLAWALWLEYCQGVGHLVGYLAGPGDSPLHLR